MALKIANSADSDKFPYFLGMLSRSMLSGGVPLTHLKCMFMLFNILLYSQINILFD